MEVLNALEQKIKSLVALIQDLKDQNKKLNQEKDALKAEFDAAKSKIETLQSENERLTVENEQMFAKLDTVQSSVVKGNERIEELNHEKKLTKNIVDDLIKSINSLVESENLP